MKKTLFILLSLVLLSLPNCNQKSPEQIAKESLEKRSQAQEDEKTRAQELLIIAGGSGEYRLKIRERKAALKELREMFPNNEEMEKIFDKIQKNIETTVY